MNDLIGLCKRTAVFSFSGLLRIQLHKLVHKTYSDV